MGFGSRVNDRRPALLSRFGGEVAVSGPGGQVLCAPGPDSRTEDPFVQDEIDRTDYLA